MLLYSTLRIAGALEVGCLRPLGGDRDAGLFVPLILESLLLLLLLLLLDELCLEGLESDLKLQKKGDIRCYEGVSGEGNRRAVIAVK